MSYQNNLTKRFVFPFNDPAFEPILTRALVHETDSQVRRFVELFAGIKREQEQIALACAAAPRFPLRGRCDFCGKENLPVRRDFETEIGAMGRLQRHAYICAQCE